MSGLTIGRVARDAGLAIDTVRYYEREGLLERPARTSSGYRQYPADAVARLQFIRQAKELGFTLSEIRELLALKVAPGKSCADVRARAEAKIADIEQRVAQLTRMKRALARLAAACSGRGPTSECPILDAMERRRLAP
ncbi:MAG TPA: heavy metal-responsive transcriptional regulator [Burkholderiales bacterium]|nr:heavy metal-responsive transcriptional regulator [Burkholderiales bacterium]